MVSDEPSWGRSADIAPDWLDERSCFRRTLVGSKRSHVSAVVHVPLGFRRTLVGSKPVDVRVPVAGRVEFQTNPRGVEATRRVSGKRTGGSVSDEPSWGRSQGLKPTLETTGEFQTNPRGVEAAKAGDAGSTTPSFRRTLVGSKPCVSADCVRRQRVSDEPSWGRSVMVLLLGLFIVLVSDEPSWGRSEDRSGEDVDP